MRPSSESDQITAMRTRAPFAGLRYGHRQQQFQPLKRNIAAQMRAQPQKSRCACPSRRLPTTEKSDELEGTAMADTQGVIYLTSCVHLCTVAPLK
jgi:hypothetical protein